VIRTPYPNNDCKKFVISFVNKYPSALATRRLTLPVLFTLAIRTPNPNDDHLKFVSTFVTTYTGALTARRLTLSALFTMVIRTLLSKL
jgi:hypothetical protein